ncbi:histidine phosphatase family protein [Streptacidiphilus sp. ASG 303]|uniref:histidine phosphatase family protein n=1 Tax=Streptacidiphilus sp. ASG 303 TaxID=2896847 RepID=UPI001E3F9C07|nr:histidine phosphatase family protein [Streptacidiphilus sp. ASG 303]MCD0482864.1 histidine phosphatase family protein [Streptacidiphilus sp. ASG 303]
MGGPPVRGAGLPPAIVAVRHGESTANALFAVAEAAGALEVPIDCRDADIPLTALGRRQADALGRRLAALPGALRPQAVWCSPYVRARQTAEHALAGFGAGLPVRYDERLRDRELGVLEMLTAAAIEVRHPEEAARRRRLGPLYYRPPGGESWADVALRVRSLLADLAGHDGPTGRADRADGADRADRADRADGADRAGRADGADRADHAGPDGAGTGDGRPGDGRPVLLVCHDNVVLMLRHVLEGLDEAALLAVHAAGPVGNASVSAWRREAGRMQPVCFNETGHLAGLPR